MKFERMEFKLKERIDQEREQTGAGDSCWLSTTRLPQHHSVLVLREVDESERAGRCCRVLRYQTKLVCRSKETDLKSGQGFRVRQPDKRRVCEICDVGHESGVMRKKAENERNSFGDGKSLHLAKHERQSVKYKCKLCGKEYARNQNLIYHMRIHTGETPYTCMVCQKGFRREDWLFKHMNVHEDKPRASSDCKAPKRRACDQFERTYKNEYSLLQHLRIHRGVRPYQCAICKKRFYFEANLQIHLRCHSDDRPFTCSQCGHSFKRVGTLKKHMRIHTGEKPYSCELCGKRLRYRYSMSMHMKTCPRS